MANGDSYTMAPEHEIEEIRPGTLLPVPESDWELLKESVRDIEESPSWNQNAGWGLIGVAVSSLGSALTISSSQEKLGFRLDGIFLAVFLATAFGGLILIYMSRRLRDEVSKSKEDCLLWISRVERRWGGEQDESDEDGTGWGSVSGIPVTEELWEMWFEDLQGGEE